MNDESELASKNEVIRLSKIWGRKVHDLKDFSICRIHRFRDTEECITEDEDTALKILIVEILVCILLKLIINESLDNHYELAFTMQGFLIIGCFWGVYAFYRKMKECRNRRKKITEDLKWREFFDTYHALVKNFNLDEWRVYNESEYCKKNVSNQIALRIKQLKARQRDSKYAFDVLAERESLVRDYNIAWQFEIVDVGFEAAMAKPQ